MEKLKSRVKIAVLKALNNEVISRAQTSRGALGTSGSFIIGKLPKNRNSISGKKIVYVTPKRNVAKQRRRKIRPSQGNLNVDETEAK